MTTEQFLAEVKERLEKATPGKWESRCIQKQIYPGHWALYGGGTDAVFIDDPWDWTQKDRPEIKQVCADADLIANAPTDLARLVKMVEMLHEYMAMIASAEVLGQVKSELAQEALILCDRIAGAGSGEMKGMQAEDIPNELILNWLAEHQGKWSFLSDDGSLKVGSGSDTVFAPFTFSKKTILAKFKKLHKQGLVGGCCCGCRGDFEITDKGLALIGKTRTVEYSGY